MPLLLILVIGAWFLFGDPPKTVANWFWSEDAAPWEEVDAYYYPDRSDPASYRSELGLASVQECRDWVYGTASLNDDPALVRGDYECAVEQVDSLGGSPVYRLAVR